MTEQTLTNTSIDPAASSFNSHLLRPVMEGNTLESEHVCSFLAGRLSAEEGDEAPASNTWWAGVPLS
jgi:hypothetical protein